MKLQDFAIERYFARYEFTAKYMLSSSDCDGYAVADVLALATDAEREVWEKLTLGYTETRGSLALRQAIKTHYQAIALDEILVASPSELNFALMNVALQAGDHVVCMAPMYQSLYQIALDLGCQISRWEPTITAEKWDYDVAHLERLITPKTKMLIVNFPHNPTGFSPSRAAYDAIIAVARRHGLLLFADEMYRLLDHGDTDRLPPACELYENAVSLWGTAKTFGLAGLRLGWLCSQNKALLHKIEAFKDYLSICSSATSEVLATIALNHAPALIGPNIAKIQANLALFSAFHQRHTARFDFPYPQAGSTAFIHLKIQETAMEFAEKLVQKTGIMLLPSETFEFGQAHARIGFGRRNFGEILGILDAYLKEY